MVYSAPSKSARDGKSGPSKNGNKGKKGRGKEQDALATKADLLVKLTRQAEEHTRILERERAALGLPSRPNRVEQPKQHPYQQQQPKQHPPTNNVRNRRGNYHVYTDQVNKKVFDPRQIPGLGGGDGGGGGGRECIPQIVPPDVSDAEHIFNQTFPDSPNFYPGRVFAIPGTIPAPPNQPQAKPDGGTIVVAPWGGPPQGAAASNTMVRPQSVQGQEGVPWQRCQAPSPDRSSPPMCQPPMSQPPVEMGLLYGQRCGPVGMGLRPGIGEPPQLQHAGIGQPPSADVGGPQLGIGIGAAAVADPEVAARIEAETRKEAYRRELEEQIRAKRQTKEAEERRRRAEDAAWEARAAAAPQHWDPDTRAGRRRGGDEYVHEDYGRRVANLRQQIAVPGSLTGNNPGPGAGLLSGMPPAQLGGRLTVELSSGAAGAFPGPGGAQVAPLALAVLPPPEVQGPVPMPGGVGGLFDGPPAPMLSPSHIPPVSPGNRRFMAAMNDLIAGPSDEQRRQKEMARQRLQMDLEEQIREKRERQERERAEMERQRLKEEADMKALQENMAAQRQAEIQHSASGAGSGGAGPISPSQQLQRHASSAGGMAGLRPPLPPRRHGKGGKVIDASWLDVPKAPPPPALPPLSSPQVAAQMLPGRGLLDWRASTGMADDELVGSGPASAPMSPGPGRIGRAPSHDGAASNGVGRGNMTTVLQRLQEEQARIREDFARQAAAMEKLANDASRALADRDEAWRELQRVKAGLAGGLAAGGDLMSGADKSLDLLGIGTVIVDTHLVPKTTNSIPDPLPKPVSSEVLRRGRMESGAPNEGMEGRLLSTVLRRGGDNGFAAGLLGDGFGYGDLGPLQGPALNRNGVRRSGIPLPPGMNPAGVAQHRPSPQRIQSVYGLDSPPKSRYNSFFGLEQGSPGSPGNGRSGAGASRLPSLGSQRPPPLRPPASPAILRGDHLPSPIKQIRGQQHSEPGGARARSGHPNGGGRAAERPIRGRATSAVQLQSQPTSSPELPPVAPYLTTAGTAGAAASTGPSGRQVSRRSLEGMQKVLRRGHEEKLLRGPLGLGSEDGTGSSGMTVELVAEEVPPTSRAGAGSRRSREPSLPGHTEMMSPGTAADYLGGTGVAAHARAGGGARAGTRSFFSDSIASYKSLLSHRSASAQIKATGAEAADPQAEELPVTGDASSQVRRRSLTQVGTIVLELPPLASRERGSGIISGVGVALDNAAATMRTGSAVSAADSQSSNVPMQRPVRAGRRLSLQRVPSPAAGRAPMGDYGSGGNTSDVAETRLAVED